MKRIYLFFIFLAFSCSIGFAQDQLENSGYEEWEIISATATDTIREPFQWSSLKTSDNAALSAFAPVVCARSSEAHSGKYSLKLANVSSLLVANGIATNGRIHPDLNTVLAYTFTDTVNEAWHTKFSSRPDSIAGWFMYAPQGGDSMQVKVSLHKGYGKQPDADFESTWIAMAEFWTGVNTAGEWVRFSTPFTYFSEEDPEYALVVISSGNAYKAVAGSVAYYDDLEMIYNSTSSRINPEKPDVQITNSGLRTLWIRGTDLSDYNQIRIFSITGKLVWNERLETDRIDLSEANLPQGIYVVSLSGSRKIFTQKLMLR